MPCFSSNQWHYPICQLLHYGYFFVQFSYLLKLAMSYNTLPAYNTFNTVYLKAYLRIFAHHPNLGSLTGMAINTFAVINIVYRHHISTPIAMASQATNILTFQ